MDESEKSAVACALRYDAARDQAPVVVAAGKGAMAEKIIEIARAEDVPVYQESDLADTLFNLGFGAEIPPRLYEVVARILVFVARVDKEAGGAAGRKSG
ncbi:MAG: EscU/YscU/HrcU family type III secretion system export apparatus switch protein [Peptococcaceae bacterium]|jgi:flagellar biosynthesis protein|nr:EscU/YscU/HrcU family type III secretion system export apparatus switch protein [Peptococcaceae bacterium]